MPPELPAFANFDEVLGSCQRFLLAVANEELPAELRAKGGASDLVQQTLAAAIRSEQQFRGRSIGELRAWLRAILRSEAAAFRRRFSGTAARDVRRERSVDCVISQDNCNPVAVALRTEQREQLISAVDQLPHDLRQALVLRLDEALGFAEIGRRMERSEEAARKLFGRALDRLRGRLGDDSDAHS